MHSFPCVPDLKGRASFRANVYGISRVARDPLGLPDIEHAEGATVRHAKVSVLQHGVSLGGQKRSQCLHGGESIFLGHQGRHFSIIILYHIWHELIHGITSISAMPLSGDGQL